MTKATCFVVLGKFGDIISLLPAFKKSFTATGRRPVVMVNEQYQSALGGVSYVEPWTVTHDWPSGTVAARNEAESRFSNVIVPQFWNDDRPMAAAASDSVLSLNGIDHRINVQEWPNCSEAMWSIAGLDQEDLKHFRVELDLRDMEREKAACTTVSNWKKPVILYNLDGASCPFGLAPELLKALWPMSNMLQLVDLSRVRCEKVYDLVGLMDRAAGMITVDTSTLHLASASRVPYIAFTNDSWSRAKPMGNCVLEVPYSRVESMIKQIAQVVYDLAAAKRGEFKFTPHNPDNPPGIVSQTPWPVRFINELPKDADYFNCGLVDRPDGRWLVTRQARGAEGNPFGVNNVVVFPMRDGKVCGDGQLVQQVRVSQDEHFEDPRCFYFNGKTYLSMCNFVWGKVWTGAHQILCEVDDNWVVRKRYDVVFGKNGNHVGTNTGMEKNWLWFFHDAVPHMIYKTQPHIVAAFSPSFNPTARYETFSNGINWPWGEMRGGTPPVLIGDRYWTFFHSSTSWAETGSRRYHMGAYTFEAKPPFRKLSYSIRPIFSGSQYDTWAHPKPLVVFPLGSILKDGRWAVTMGVNDLNCAIAEIPHSELEKMMTPIKP